MLLQMAVKAVNDTVGPNGLIPPLLVFKAYPRLTSTDSPSLIVTQRATAITKATLKLNRLRASRMVTNALAQRNGPNTLALYNLPINLDVLV